METTGTEPVGTGNVSVPKLETRLGENEAVENNVKRLEFDYPDINWKGLTNQKEVIKRIEENRKAMENIDRVMYIKNETMRQDITSKTTIKEAEEIYALYEAENKRNITDMIYYAGIIIAAIIFFLALVAFITNIISGEVDENGDPIEKNQVLFYVELTVAILAFLAMIVFGVLLYMNHSTKDKKD